MKANELYSDLAFPPAVAFKSLSWYHHQATSRESCELCATMGLEAAVAAVMAAFAAAAVAIRSRKKQALQVLWGVVHDPLLAWCLGCGCTCPSHPSRGGTSHPCRGGTSHPCRGGTSWVWLWHWRQDWVRPVVWVWLWPWLLPRVW